MTCAALKVSRTGADQDFVLADHTLAAAPAYAAVRVHNNCSSFHKGVDQAFLQCLEIDSLACRNDKETNQYLFFRNASLRNPDYPEVIVIYMEGAATLEELKEMFQ